MRVIWLFIFIASVSTTDIVFVIINESHPVHNALARNLKDDIAHSSLQFRNLNVTTHIATEDFAHIPSWIYITLFKRLDDLYSAEKNCWFVFIPETTIVNLTEVVHLLSNTSKDEKIFFGRGVQDHDSSIIHHFDQVRPESPFLYPDSRTGIILSQKLLHSLSNYITSRDGKKLIDFSIDPEYELAKLVENVNSSLTSSHLFCLRSYLHEHQPCAIIYNPRNFCMAAKLNDVYFSIKTCQKYHKERLPVLQSTWLPHVTRFTLYSDSKDPEFGTVSTGVKNTESGHCAKTLHIIHEAAKLNDVKWLVIADDDTLLSVPRLVEFIGCYDHRDDIALGQRYGYSLLNYYGYDYLTGGAGMVLSITLVKKLVEKGVCVCPSPDTPDDMFIGMCLKRLQVPIIHSHLFHQARPDDYADKLLEGSAHISFHKFWLIDPVKQYNKWLNTSQLVVEKREVFHTEL